MASIGRKTRGPTRPEKAEEHSEKARAIDEIVGFQQRLSRVFLNTEFEHWRRLAVPMAQLKSLFIVVHKSGTNSRTLAKYLDVTQGNVTGIVDRLVQQGLVTRTPSPEDRRTAILEATDKGRSLLTNLMEGQNKHLGRILTRMRLEEISHLRQGLAAFVRAAEEYEKEFNRDQTDPSS